jgi:serine/threonine protein kinase
LADIAAPQPVLRGRYHLGDELSRTAAVVTRRGRDELLQREVAVTMPGEPEPAEAEGHRLELARHVLASLDHPALPRVFDGGTDRGRPYLITELFGGESLGRRRERGPLDPSAAARVGAALADLLTYLHARDLIHGAMPSAAVWIEEDGRVRVSGLGITRAPEDPQGWRAATADDVASLGRLLRAATAPEAMPETIQVRRWAALLDRMTAAAFADRPTPAEVRARLKLLTADTASRRAAEARAVPRAEESLTPRDLISAVPAVPATAPLARLGNGRARVAVPMAVLTTAAATLVAALLITPALSTLNGETDGNPSQATAAVGTEPTPVRPSPTSPADPIVIPAGAEPPTVGAVGEAGREQAPKHKAQHKAEGKKKKDEGKAVKEVKAKGQSGKG